MIMKMQKLAILEVLEVWELRSVTQCEIISS